jgi:hypothetical protein
LEVGSATGFGDACVHDTTVSVIDTASKTYPFINVTQQRFLK